MARAFHIDINKVVDIMMLGKTEFLKSYSYLTEEDFYETLNNILHNNFSLDQIKEYREFLINEGREDVAKKIV